MLEPFQTHEVFNQSPPFQDVNLFTSDRPLMEAVKREGAAGALERLGQFGATCGSAEALEQARLANENAPRLMSFDSKGARLDLVEYHPAYHVLMQISMAQGLHASVWEHLAEPGGGGRRPGASVERSAGCYLANQMEAGHQCPITMTNAAVPTLLMAPELAAQWLPKILARTYDKALRPLAQKRSVTIGMGMTEKQGGTDVRANTTRAEPVGGRGPGAEYLITGHKWFMSAPMSDAFLVLAQAPGGLSCFLLPGVLPDGKRNALRFQRLKDKLGNRSNASSEVEFQAAHGWLIGQEGRGVANIMEMVTLTRLDCAVASAGLMRLALANAIHHCRHRRVFQKHLIDQPLMQHVLADMALDVEAATALAFRLARAFDRAEEESEAAWRRLMTPVTKYWVCKMGPALGYEALECLGGNGYVEAGLAARLYRELPLNAIWEGSGNVMALDLLRVLEREPETFAAVLDALAALAGPEPTLRAELERLHALSQDPAGLMAQGRDLIESLARLAAGALLRAEAPAAVGDAFLGTRFSRASGRSYGHGLAGADTRAIVERALAS
ncbi:MAG TPA: isovaleryl-CoA dehydrogenase [Hyphomicrobiaceae bacterium]|nr:isovaleryl-CoA dehydrogenase [Hyphomicrobiaceae bacterium]